MKLKKQCQRQTILFYFNSFQDFSDLVWRISRLIRRWRKRVLTRSSLPTISDFSPKPVEAANSDSNLVSSGRSRVSLQKWLGMFCDSMSRSRSCNRSPKTRCCIGRIGWFPKSPNLTKCWNELIGLCRDLTRCCIEMICGCPGQKKHLIWTAWSFQLSLCRMKRWLWLVGPMWLKFCFPLIFDFVETEVRNRLLERTGWTVKLFDDAS